MKKILFVMLSTLICATLFAIDNSNDIVYAEDSLSAELKIGASYFDGEEHFFTFKIPQNKTIKVTRISSSYINGQNDEEIHMYVNDSHDEDLVDQTKRYIVGVFVDTVINAQTITVFIDNFLSNYSFNPKDPAITIRFAVIEEHPSTESILLNGDVEVVSGAFSTSGYQDFMGTKVTAILGDDYNEYTCFGSARGGMIRGSNEGYLILSGNPNGYGNRNVYINRYTSNGDIIMTAGSGQVGIGVDDPKEKLHINGAIRGGGANGEVTLKGDSGYVTIGASNLAMEFVTDKSQFVFNKPIYNQSGIYNVRNSNLIFNINDTTRMTILHSSGNVGIGILNPATRLHINDGALKIGLSTSASERLKNILQFGDSTYVQIGEWEKDDYLSFKASGYNFTNGNVGIGKLSPTCKLDVAGTMRADSIIADGLIRAEEIIVETSGADFVFAEDYQLRPLSEVKAFVEENKHLPEIKSAQEMQENGVSVSELQIQLLQKIEELTLYILQQEERIRQQDLRIKALEAK